MQYDLNVTNCYEEQGILPQSNFSLTMGKSIQFCAAFHSFSELLDYIEYKGIWNVRQIVNVLSGLYDEGVYSKCHLCTLRLLVCKTLLI